MGRSKKGGQFEKTTGALVTAASRSVHCSKNRKNPDEPYFCFETWRGRPSLRYATASRMRARCINCHNNHKDTPKDDWKEGDVRGVFEVIFPVDKAGATPRGGRH